MLGGIPEPGGGNPGGIIAGGRPCPCRLLIICCSMSCDKCGGMPAGGIPWPGPPGGGCMDGGKPPGGENCGAVMPGGNPIIGGFCIARGGATLNAGG